jgi:hypothetical protein
MLSILTDSRVPVDLFENLADVFLKIVQTVTESTLHLMKFGEYKSAFARINGSRVQASVWILSRTRAGSLCRSRLAP